MRAIAPHTSGWRRGAAPHLPASPTNRRRSTLGVSHVIALAPWPLVLRLSPRPAWAMIVRLSALPVHRALRAQPFAPPPSCSFGGISRPAPAGRESRKEENMNFRLLSFSPSGLCSISLYYIYFVFFVNFTFP